MCTGQVQVGFRLGLILLVMGYSSRVLGFQVPDITIRLRRCCRVDPTSFKGFETGQYFMDLLSIPQHCQGHQGITHKHRKRVTPNSPNDHYSFTSLYVLQHSSKIRGLCLMKCSNETIQKENRTFSLSAHRKVQFLYYQRYGQMIKI